MSVSIRRGLVATFLVPTALLLSGCVATGLTLSDSRIASRTASVLGVSPEAVQISNRQNSAGSTTYIAHVGGRRFACVIAGGSVMTYGMVTPPNCNPALDVSGQRPRP